MIVFLDLRTGIATDPATGAQLGSIMSPRPEMLSDWRELAIEFNADILAARLEELKRPGRIF